jgi:hypothetical protein
MMLESGGETEALFSEYSKDNGNMRKTNFWVMTVVVATLFVMTLVYLSLTGSGLKQAPADTTESVEAGDALMAGAPDMTATPTAAPTDVPVFIPGFDDLPESYSLDTLKTTPTGFIVTENEAGFNMEWMIVIGADYYIFCTSDDGTEFRPEQIFSGSMYQWEHLDKAAAGFLVMAFSDDALFGTEGDVMLKAYRFIPVTPTPTNTPTPNATKAPRATTTPRPTATPKPTSAPLPYKIIVDKADCAFAVFALDDNGEYTRKVATYPAALGGSNTPLGTHKIGAKILWHTWTGFNPDEYSPYTSRYASTKSGKAVYFHGPVYYSTSFDDLHASYYNAIGDPYATGGCVRTTVAGARFVYYNCAAGTVVEVVSSSELVSYPGKPAIDPNYPTWDPTDPDKPVAPTPTVTETPTPTVTETPTPTPSPTPTSEPTSPSTSAPTAEPSPSG